ncbi:MAG TPA: beta-ketoacyl-[acyl-carrier-protein] synthase family protein [Candidatus Dormibacteraeota bacterium]|nr:beta-ketoacyl-[acyl-carrier-protein] synthase family protein [Candidatus Dormibacteraeota bacterium]
MENVVVTGMGIVSPIGCGVPNFWARLIAGESAVKPIPGGDALTGNRLWAAVGDDFLESTTLPRTALRNADRFTQYALVAAHEAVAQSGLESLDPLRTGVLVGNTMGGFPLVAQTQTQFLAEGNRSVPPKLMALVIPNMPAASIALHWGLHGPQLGISTACASSLDAVGTAARMIERGEIDVAIAGGTETLLCHVVYESLVRAGALSKNPCPATASRPFDAERDGFVMGDGSAMLVLERAERSRARNARVLARIRGYGQVADGYHITSPEPSGRWEASAMSQALAEAALPASDPVRVVYAHGTSTIVGDAAELRAINRVFAHAASPPVVTSLKGHLGHGMAASGAMSAIAGILGMEQALVTQTLGTRRLDPAVAFDVVTERPRAFAFSSFHVNAFGFGGQNSSLVISR